MSFTSPDSVSDNHIHMTGAQREAAKRVILLTAFLDILGFGIIIPQLAVYASEFGASPLIVGVLASTYSAMSFLSTPVWGRLSDRMGRRPIMLYSIFGTALGYVLFAFAHSLPLLFLARVVDGITAGNISTAQAYLSDITPAEERSKTFGIFGAVFGVGFAIGPGIGALLTHLPSPWNGNLGVGLFTAALSFTTWALALKFLPESLPPRVRALNAQADRDNGTSTRKVFNVHGFRRAFALPGLNLMIAISFFATLAFATMQGTYTLFLIKQYARPEVQNYIRTEPQAASLEAQREKSQARSTASKHATAGLSGSKGGAITTGENEHEPYPASLGGDFVWNEQPAPEGLTWRSVEKLLVRTRAAQMAAYIFAAIGIVALITQGGLIDPLKKRFGELPLIVTGTLLMAIGLALIPLPPTLGGQFPVAALLAFGNSIATPVLTALVSELAPENERGEMIGVYQSVGSLGRIIGPNIGGGLFNAFGYAIPYFAGGAIMMISFVFALKLRNACANRISAASEATA